MNKQILIAAGLAAFAATPSLAAQKTYALGDFTGVSAATGVSVDINTGGDYSVKAESSDKGLERLEVKVVDGELRIKRTNHNFRWRRSDKVHVTVSLPSLKSLDVSSGAAIDAKNVDAGEFSIDASSGGSIDAEGKCDDLSVDVSSGGSIDARALQCRAADADASSGGSARIYASESVTGEASSGGSVRIFGEPEKVSKETSSGGSVSVQ